MSGPAGARQGVGSTTAGAGKLRRWLPWLAMVVVVAVALAVGSARRPQPSLDQRVASIAAQVRCPVCQGETAAESDTPPSVEIRAFIRQALLKGENPAQIKGALVGDYGPSILEAPAKQGLALWVWMLPVVAVAAGVGGLAWAFARWRRLRSAAGAPSDDDRDLVGEALRAGG